MASECASRRDNGAGRTVGEDESEQTTKAHTCKMHSETLGANLKNIFKKPQGRCLLLSEGRQREYGSEGEERWGTDSGEGRKQKLQSGNV